MLKVSKNMTDGNQNDNYMMHELANTANNAISEWVTRTKA